MVNLGQNYLKGSIVYMQNFHAVAVAHPNIAFIKYWGNRDDLFRLPANGSISMNLGNLFTQTQVEFSPDFTQDSLSINHQSIIDQSLVRVSAFLDLLRSMSHNEYNARVTSSNNFPTGAGIASSAAAFAALALAATSALGLELDEASLSRLARRGSGSACRSIPTGFVEWQPGEDHQSSYAFSIAPPEHWELVDCIAIVESGPKAVGSTEGHASAGTSPLQVARVADTPRRLDLCKSAIQHKDFDALAAIVELDSNLMHAVMITSTPPIFYWSSTSLELMKAIPTIRRSGLPVCYTLDAGSNVHVLCPADAAPLVESHLTSFPGVEQVLVSSVGGPAHLVEEND